jgi:two-component system sensor histidine kinase MprB
MSFRARITVIAAAAVAFALLVGSFGIYVLTARSLLRPVDRALVDLVDAPRADRPGQGRGRLGGAGGYVQVVGPGGEVVSPSGPARLPVTDRTRAVASGDAAAFFGTVTIDGERVRVYTAPVRRGMAVQAARPLGELDEALGVVRRQLLLGSLAGIGVAALLGLAVASRAVKPVDDLTALAEEVATTQDLSRRIAVDGGDEIARLAAAFNLMLANLEQARSAQQQLVADASHELRTPLTSLRTNIEVLADVERLDAGQRRALIDDVVVQLDEFGRLVAGLVELARGDQPAEHAVAARLDELVAQVADRARTFAPPDRELRLHLTPTTVIVEPARIERAVANLIDNAIKYGAGPVDVTVANGRVEVADRGPGVDPADGDRIFARFYRAARDRDAPGSGLGLSIVAQAAAAHGGSVSVAPREGGGAVFTFALGLEEASNGRSDT